MSAPTSHPIRRIRESFLKLSDESGMKKLASVSGFAKWLGRSESLIRNVENNVTEFSGQLARLIELKTGVSSDWMLSDDAATSIILAKDGSPWDAAEYLDPYVRGGLLFKMGLILDTKPDIVPALVAKLVEARLVLELQRNRYFEDEVLGEKGARQNLRATFEGHATLRAILKAIRLSGPEEKGDFEYLLSHVFNESRPIDELRTTWNFLSMLDDQTPSAPTSVPARQTASKPRATKRGKTKPGSAPGSVS